MIFALPILAFAAALPQDFPPEEKAHPCWYIQRHYYDVRFEPGQRWSYHSRSTDADSTVTIAEIDNIPGFGEVVHILVDHVGSQPSPKVPKHLGSTQHFAINRDSLDASVVALVDSGRIPDVGSDYDRWAGDCTGRTYTSTVADTLTTLDFLECERNLKASRHSSPSAKCTNLTVSQPKPALDSATPAPNSAPAAPAMPTAPGPTATQSPTPPKPQPNP